MDPTNINNEVSMDVEPAENQANMEYEEEKEDVYEEKKEDVYEEEEEDVYAEEEDDVYEEVEDEDEEEEDEYEEEKEDMQCDEDADEDYVPDRSAPRELSLQAKEGIMSLSGRKSRRAQGLAPEVYHTSTAPDQKHEVDVDSDVDNDVDNDVDSDVDSDFEDVVRMMELTHLKSRADHLVNTVYAANPASGAPLQMQYCNICQGIKHNVKIYRDEKYEYGTLKLTKKDLREAIMRLTDIEEEPVMVPTTWTQEGGFADQCKICTRKVGEGVQVLAGAVDTGITHLQPAYMVHSDPLCTHAVNGADTVGNTFCLLCTKAQCARTACHDQELKAQVADREALLQAKQQKQEQQSPADASAAGTTAEKKVLELVPLPDNDPMLQSLRGRLQAMVQGEVAPDYTLLCVVELSLKVVHGTLSLDELQQYWDQEFKPRVGNLNTPFRFQEFTAGLPNVTTVPKVILLQYGQDQRYHVVRHPLDFDVPGLVQTKTNVDRLIDIGSDNRISIEFHVSALTYTHTHTGTHFIIHVHLTVLCTVLCT